MCVLSAHADTSSASLEQMGYKWLRFQRQKLIGLNRAKAEGKLGRHPIKINDEILTKFTNSDCSEKPKVAREAGVSVATLYRRIKSKSNQKGGLVNA